MRNITSVVQKLFRDVLERDPTAQELAVFSHQLLMNFNEASVLRLRNQLLQAMPARDRDVRCMFCNDVGSPSVQRRETPNGRLLVVGMVRNIAGNLHLTQKLLADLRAVFSRVCFYFYHNNSSDDSERLLREWCQADPDVAGTFAPAMQVAILSSDGKPGNRIPQFARMRNRNMTDALERFGRDFDYVMMTNTDLVGPVDVRGVVDSLAFSQPWDVLCGNCVFPKSRYHYDAFALRLPDDPEDTCVLYPKFRKHYGKTSDWLDKVYVFDGFTRVKSGFGDMCVFQAAALWDALDANGGLLCDVDDAAPHMCELISMCKRFKNVWVTPLITYDATVSVERVLYDAPKCFVPRDAGFFSVVNFFVGQLARLGRVYPNFDRDAFQRVNGTNAPKHFCYFTDRPNAWFDYFEPVSFYKDDTEHVTGQYKSYEVTQGHEAPEAFRRHETYAAMMRNTQSFGQWRRDAHEWYRRFLRPVPEVALRVHAFWDQTFRGARHVVGVHYRHPSHCVEQGQLFLKDYFAAVDKVLRSKPSAKIFLATDSDFGIACFAMRYGAKVQYMRDVHRLDVDSVLEWGYAMRRNRMDAMGFVDGKGYQLHYKLCEAGAVTNVPGRDVLCEALCLAKCGTLIHSVSNVALAVSYMNPNLEMILVA
jgi:hypothetical protein